MAALKGKWVKLSQNGTGPGARSSHAIAVVGQKAYVFGGEFTPRVPVDNKMHVFDLETQTWSVPEAAGDVPPPRVGVTMSAVGQTIYVFGGRDAEHKELNELYSYDTASSTWALLSSGDLGPPHRSYHSMTADDRRVYVFGGCGDSGRLKDLWAYDAAAAAAAAAGGGWIKFPEPGPNCLPRGGPGLAVSSSSSSSSGSSGMGGSGSGIITIWVVYGFSGKKELDDVHCFNPATEEWTVVEEQDATGGDKPSPRSVFCSAAIGDYVFLYGGEVDPSDLGHLGAGKFSEEVYVLHTKTRTWKKVAVEDAESPGPRGWCAFSAGQREGKPGLLVYGGNSPTNDRLGDLFFFTPSF